MKIPVLPRKLQKSFTSLAKKMGKREGVGTGHDTQEKKAVTGKIKRQ